MMKSNLGPRKGNGEASLKRYKPSALPPVLTPTKNEANERRTSIQDLYNAFQEREDRANGPLSTETNVGVEAKQAGADESQSWAAIKKVRNRLNAQKGRQKQQNQMKFLEHEQLRLSSSNGALSYQNAHLKDAIRQIKKERYASKNKHAIVVDASSTELNTRIPSQQTGRGILDQQQFAALLQGLDDLTRRMPQGLPLTAHGLPPLTAASRTEWAPAATTTLRPMSNMNHASAPFGGMSTGQNFCCEVYMVYSALDPSIKLVYHGSRHHPLCRSCR
ncbi:unnamed protein product [Cylindrotheca closterium]|uniref:BZIP domain-containing protein n=1 Tax=Cylindrotheca closterium TaxID=2856 RepID=A0AAD2G1Q3_9STRA|nr:unnamed protein product [Cylindrotheca closterium]